MTLEYRTVGFSLDADWRIQTAGLCLLAIGGLFAALFPVGILADISNSGTLFVFIMVAIGVMILRKQQPNRHRPFRTPLVWVVCPLAVAGCLLLFVNLSMYTISLFFGWAIIGLVVYRFYGYKHSDLGRGLSGPEGGEVPPPEPPFHEGPQA